MLRPRVLTVLVLAVLVGLAPVWAAPCPRNDLPAATLLFPYFEVDLDGGRTTLLSIASTTFSNEPGLVLAGTLVRITLWTDYAIPSVSFDLFLGTGDVQTMNLRDVFATGRVPTTSPPAGRFPGCSSSLGGFVTSPGPLQAKHAGLPVSELCYGSRRAEDRVVVGYVTADVVLRCNGPSMNPTRREYYRATDPILSTRNDLWGDFMFVDPGQNFASGHNAVHVRADRNRFPAGSYTFYGKYTNFNGADKRAPLSDLWMARYAIGPPFGDGDLLVWRDTRNHIPAPVNCGNRPSWAPLGEPSIVALDEDAHRQRLTTGIFDLATQKAWVTHWTGAVEAGSPPRVIPAADFGFLELNLNLGNGTDSQAWVGWIASAEERFSAGLAATPILDGCSRLAP